MRGIKIVQTHCHCGRKLKTINEDLRGQQLCSKCIKIVEEELRPVYTKAGDRQGMYTWVSK